MPVRGHPGTTFKPGVDRARSVGDAIQQWLTLAGRFGTTTPNLPGPGSWQHDPGSEFGGMLGSNPAGSTPPPVQAVAPSIRLPMTISMTTPMTIPISGATTRGGRKRDILAGMVVGLPALLAN